MISVVLYAAVAITNIYLLSQESRSRIADVCYAISLFICLFQIFELLLG